MQSVCCQRQSCISGQYTPFSVHRILLKQMTPQPPGTQPRTPIMTSRTTRRASLWAYPCVQRLRRVNQEPQVRVVYALQEHARDLARQVPRVPPGGRHQERVDALPQVLLLLPRPLPRLPSPRCRGRHGGGIRGPPARLLRDRSPPRRAGTVPPGCCVAGQVDYIILLSCLVLSFFVLMRTVSSFGMCQGMSWQHLHPPCVAGQV